MPSEYDIIANELVECYQKLKDYIQNNPGRFDYSNTIRILEEIPLTMTYYEFGDTREEGQE